MILSGYFFKKSASIHDILIYVYKKIKGLYLPFCKWVLLFILLHNFLLRFGIGNDIYSIQDQVFCMLKSCVTFVGTEPVLVGFWFIKALFTACIALCVMFYIIDKMKMNEVIIPIILVFLLSLQLLLEWNNKTYKGMFYGALFLYIGYVYHKIIKMNCKVTWFFICVCFFVVLILSQCYNNINNTEMLLVDKTTIFPFILTGTLGSIMILMVSQKICACHFVIRDALCFIGDNTMIILALHYVIIIIWKNYISSFILNVYLQNFTGCIMGVIFPILLIFIYKSLRNKVFRIFDI